MVIVGLTGNVGAGKSAVAELWRRAGVPVVSADELARQAVAPGSRALAEVAEQFGSAVLDADGALNREAVREIVFRDAEARRRLEAVVHPVVRRLRDDWTRAQRAAGAELVAWEVPLLFETGMDREVDVVVLVDAPEAARRRRIMASRGLSEAEASAVMAAQEPVSEKRERAGFVVENDGSLDQLAVRGAEVLAVVRGRIRRAGFAGNPPGGLARSLQATAAGPDAATAGVREAAPDARGAGPKAVLERLLGASSVVLVTHVSADGDGAGSEVALAAFLRGKGIRAWIVNPTPFPDAFRFLLPDPAWVLSAKGDAAARRCREADLAVVVDTDQSSRIGRVNPLIRRLPTVVVDHHPPGADPVAGMVYRDETAPAAGTLVLKVLEEAGDPWATGGVPAPGGPPWTKEIASALYVALLTDTGGFRFANATPECFRTAGRLVELGAEPAALHRAVYGHFRRRRYELLRESLAALEVHESGRIAWMTVPVGPYRSLAATPDDLEGFVDVPRSIEGVEVALLFRTTSKGDTKVSLRSTGDVVVNGVAAALGGGGHPRAAGAVVKGPPAVVVGDVVGRVEALLSSMT